LSEFVLLKLLAFGAITGLIALLFIETMNASHRLFHRLPCTPVTRPFIGGLVLLLLAVASSKDYLGLSLPLLQQSLLGMPVVAWAFLLKIVFTAATLGSGFSGGVITPLFVTGAAAGSVLGTSLGLPPALGAALGLIGLIAGAANTPIAAVILGIEMFGPNIGVFAATVAISSYLLVGHRSVYPSQLLFTQKAAALHISTNTPIEAQHLSMAWNARRRLARLRRWIRLHTPHVPSGQH
jgi:H+/Cl- antiporter ClcA